MQKNVLPFSAFRDAAQFPGSLKSGMLDLVLPPSCRFCQGPVTSREMAISREMATSRETQPVAPRETVQQTGPVDCQATPQRSDSDCETPFCDRCFKELTVSETMMRGACIRCGMPPAAIAGACVAAPDQNSPDLHAACQSCRNLQFDFDAVYSLWIYRDRVCDAVVASKFVHNAPLADALGKRLGRRLRQAFSIDAGPGDAGSGEPGSAEPGSAEREISSTPTEVTYVPSHVFRQIARGGIGTQVVAQAIAKQLSIPVRQRLRAVRPIAKQAWLDDEARKQNVSGAFATRRSYPFLKPPELDNRHILLVDDVFTTGSTVCEAARVLKNAGASRVTVAVISRAVRVR